LDSATMMKKNTIHGSTDKNTSSLDRQPNMSVGAKRAAKMPRVG
jgi:hypothetical protein